MLESVFALLLILKSTRSELNSLAVRLTSLLWMSVLTKRSINFRLFFMNPRIMTNLFESLACVVFCRGLAPTFYELESFTPQLSYATAAIVPVKAYCANN